ncbi:eCIS core domain-containing protein [Actinophytocola xanthii]|uniref:eCIS core domain-containing protein n=1 Tax=Actinophytocola xanthii TaxID=1912961 RepID=A0A1Q8CTB0_9PSEU|nr:DUF4157 domain-containing protein [Actinophytocola xanthii]OLF17601.1 hypothetical protein BU204_10310 [Actinophytocola xanthii]
MHAHEKPERESAARPPRPRPDQTTGHPGQDRPTPDALLELQRAAGNSAVAATLSGHPGEAGPVQRSTVHDVLGSSGRPLDASTRTDMEARLGADFSDVRVHTDAVARRSAEEIGARAYTSGQHVVLGRGGGDPHTLAHELTHVIQQRAGAVSGTQRDDGLSVSDPTDSFERAAEANAREVMSGRTPAVQAVGGDHGGPTTAAVQRMPLAQFQQQVSTDPQVANDPDFITYFEIRRGREDPGAVVADVQPGSQNRLRQLVETADVDAALVTQYIQDYLAGGQGTPAQPATLADPNVAGLEVELAEVVLTVASGATLNNGDLLAETAATTPAGPPLLRLEVEGLGRANAAAGGAAAGARRTASVELVYGPLPPGDYANTDLIAARTTLRKVLSARTERTKTLHDLINTYKNQMTGRRARYKLNPTNAAKQLTKNVTKLSNPSAQTNVSTPYEKVGTQAPSAGQDFRGFFENDGDTRIFDTARTRAAALAGDIDANWTQQHGNAGNLRVGAGMRSLLTHVLFQEAKYLRHTTDQRDNEPPEYKQHFHVLLKASPQDAVMSMIDDHEAQLLLAWLVDWGGVPLADAATAAFRATNTSNQTATADATTIRNYLVDVLVARLLAGRQLLAVDDRESQVFGNNREVATVRHFHPRPSNRIPITVHNNRYYLVVEQRSSRHALNRDIDTRAGQHATQIGNLQR